MIARRKPLQRSTKPIRRSPIRRGPKKVRAFIKPSQIAREKEERQREREWKKARAHCRSVTYHRAGGRCEHCGTPLKLHPKDAGHEFEIANIHEEPPRSLGGDPLDPNCTVCLCCHCHERVTHGRIKIKWRDPELRAVRPSGPEFRIAA